MNHLLSERIINLTPSPTLALDSKVKELQAKGIEIINLALGEPDFDTPAPIKNAAIRAIKQNFTHYTQTAGIPTLRAAITKEIKQETGVSYTISEVIVGNGSKQLLYEAFQVLCDKGDEVLLPIPTWSTYAEQIKLARGVVKTIPLAPPFQLKASDAEKHITKKTKILLLNSPANPTGAIIEKKELEKIAMLAEKHNLWIISDEIYNKICYEKPAVSFVSIDKKLKERTIVINGVSKSFAMTGWRIGYACAPQEIIQAMNNLQSQITSNASSISQVATLQALIGNQSCVLKMRDTFQKRRDMLIKKLEKLPRLTVIKPQGAFYLFIDIKKLLHNSCPASAQWCEELLEKKHVAVVPGEAFLYPGFIRVSFASSQKSLEEAIIRIKELAS